MAAENLFRSLEESHEPHGPLALRNFEPAFVGDAPGIRARRNVDLAAGLSVGGLAVDAGPLAIQAVTGARTYLGSALKAVPRRLAVHPRWLSAVSPLAALAARGARTYGTAGSGMAEFYGVTDLPHVTSAVVSWEGADAGALAPIRPAVTFGFSSVPPRPSVSRVRTTIVEA